MPLARAQTRTTQSGGECTNHVASAPPNLNCKLPDICEYTHKLAFKQNWFKLSEYNTPADMTCALGHIPQCLASVMFLTELIIYKNETKQQKQTCNSILALSFVFLVICFRLMSAPVRVAFPDELQSPIYVGRPGVPVN